MPAPTPITEIRHLQCWIVLPPKSFKAMAKPVPPGTVCKVCKSAHNPENNFLTFGTYWPISLAQQLGLTTTYDPANSIPNIKALCEDGRTRTVTLHSASSSPQKGVIKVSGQSISGYVYFDFATKPLREDHKWANVDPAIFELMAPDEYGEDYKTEWLEALLNGEKLPGACPVPLMFKANLATTNRHLILPTARVISDQPTNPYDFVPQPVDAELPAWDEDETDMESLLDESEQTDEAEEPICDVCGHAYHGLQRDLTTGATDGGCSQCACFGMLA